MLAAACLLVLAPVPQAPSLDALAQRCASELGWAESWTAAVERAQGEKRLILVHALLYPSFAISDEDAVSTLMDRDVQQLVLERYVPFRLRPGVECGLASPELYGLGPTSFGRGWIVARPDGRVVADGIGDLAPLLVEALRRAPEASATPVARKGEPLERAQALLRRGELEAAAALLAKKDGAIAWLLRARVHELERNGTAALAALARARGALRPGRDDELAAELDLEEAWLLARVGRLDEALAPCQRAVENATLAVGARSRAREARYLRAELDLALGAQPLAEPLLRELAAGDPADRWTWRAAGRLTSTHYSLGAGDGLAWPAPELAALTPVFDFDELPPERAARAVEPAREWLLGHQREDGSWPSPAEIGSQMDHQLSDLTLATTALAAEALLGSLEFPKARAAFERGLAYGLRSRELLQQTPLPKSYLEYGVWSRTHLLHLVAAAREAGALDRKAAAAAAQQLIEDLVSIESAHGGWSYYRTNDLKEEAAVVPSMSFTTADVALALQRARALQLVDEATVAPPLERGLTALEKMRGESSDFVYWWAPGMPVAPSAIGDSGHGPLCELALARGGRGSVGGVERALERFSAHRRELAAERGKSLMHCGPDGLGSHYVLFDALWAARALRELPAGERKRFRKPVLEVVLACRTTRGSFVDNPLIGECAGSALALLALQAALVP